MTDELRVEGHPALVKTGAAVVSNDRQAYLSALARREAQKKGEDRISSLERRVAELEKIIERIVEK